MENKKNIFKTAENYEKERFYVIKKEIERAQTISVFVHINPDGDCVGSGLALCRQLNKMGKTSFVYCDDELPEKLEYLKNMGLE